MAKYLSRTDLSHIAGRYIEQYYNFFGISKDAPEPIDPERLASSVLGLNVKMLPLCSDGSILGLTVFQKCGFTVTLGDGTKLVDERADSLGSARTQLLGAVGEAERQRVNLQTVQKFPIFSIMI